MPEWSARRERIHDNLPRRRRDGTVVGAARMTPISLLKPTYGYRCRPVGVRSRYEPKKIPHRLDVKLFRRRARVVEIPVDRDRFIDERRRLKLRHNRLLLIENINRSAVGT